MGDIGRTDYGRKSKGQIDIPKDKGGRGIPSGMPGNSDITKRAGGKGGVDSPSEKGNKGKLMGSKAGTSPYKASMGD